jgi:D-alanyl-D-alanine carboxypeptidase/D-alanyl-D-alanine-endopeptidase (penicillin-binding protein 4)
MSDWIANVLVSSDNSLSEALGKIATIEAGFDATYDNLDTAYERILEPSGLDFSGVTVRDGSGLSDLNLVSPRFMAELMRLVDSGYGDFDVIKNSLMVAGETGSLATRFQGDLSDAAGNVRAKTGYLTKVHTLNGIIEAKDGTSLTFTIYAYGAVGNDVRVAIDTLVTSFYRCGNTLSND